MMYYNKWWWDETLNRTKHCHQMQKAKDNKLLGGWWWGEGSILSIMANFLLCCLFASNGNYGLLLLTMLALLLCFCWMHFWWCGVVFATTLMEESQGVERKIRMELYGVMRRGFNTLSTKEEISSMVNCIWKIMCL